MCVRACVCVKQMQVWDTAGQERFRTITQSYYRSAHGAIIAYDITRHSTFDSVTHWIKEVELYGASNVLLVLIGQFSSSPAALDSSQIFQSRAQREGSCRHVCIFFTSLFFVLKQETNATWKRIVRSCLRKLATWRKTEASSLH